ncbi:PKD domain-containing protein [Parapedobacter composti]|uniref:PKD domain-containing protein n=1 Tax=Parapedobacter composti TaxID=623281 RepID=A0A1I1J468_9SPHI|nr:PKD domain-containing protein [Parapedobacter composti]SFC43357.1 PKD domain-containing protein [Parapedobacter composti]
MKSLKLLHIICAILLFTGCDRNEVLVLEHTGEHIANFDFPEGQVYAPAKVRLTNRSRNADSFLWEYAGGKTIYTNGDTVDVSQSDKMVPDTILYELPGTYTVKLVARQGSVEKEVSKSVTILKQQPEIIVPENIGIFLDVTFSARVFRFPGRDIAYEWDFGEAGTSTLPNPTVQFETEGEHVIKLTVNDGEETLSTETTIWVQGELAKTIYFTDALTRRIYRYKLTTQTESEVEWIGVTTGYNPFGLSVKGDKLYLSETGLGTRFSSGDAARADGVLKSFNLDGTGENLITRPVATSLDYRDDPWMNTVDRYGNIWWTCRNWGVRVINASSSEAAYPSPRFNINATIAGEATTTYFASDIKEVGNEIWVSYAGTTGKGIYKFGYDGAYIGKIGGEIAKHAVRAFVVDHVNGHIYFATNRADEGRALGLYRTNLDGSGIVAVDNHWTMNIGAGGYSDQGAAGEYVYITNIDIVVDENGEGYLYYPYRAISDVYGSGNPPTLGASAANSGIKRYNLNGTEPATFLLKGYAPYGMAVDQVKR